MKSRLLSVTILLAVVMILTAAMIIKTDPRKEFLERRAILVVREIGHHLLLQSGDSTSRVLPVKQLGDNIFQLEFQNPFSFMPDSLVKTVQGKLASGDLPLDYMVNVFDCSTREIIYGFEIRSNKSDIEPCLGRVQPVRCYSIQIAFFDLSGSADASALYFISFIVLAGIAVFAFTGSRLSKRKTRSPEIKKQSIKIGKYEFDERQKALKSDDENILLSNKESKVLGILAANLNQLIDRDHLLRQVWENEGVITGRSLDMFVSKLRRKLNQDPSIRITNVHGRGYKLEIGERES